MKQISLEMAHTTRHIYHDRKGFDFKKLATLVNSIYHVGLSETNPIVAIGHPNDAEKMMIVSGHRRFFATVIARLVEYRTTQNGGKKPDYNPQTIELLLKDENYLNTQSDTLTLMQLEAFVEMATSVLPAKEQTIPAILFEGTFNESSVALHTANSGDEPPDLLGRALSFWRIVNDKAASLPKLANQAGLSLKEAEELAGLAQLHNAGEFGRELARNIDKKSVPLSVAYFIATIADGDKAMMEVAAQVALEKNKVGTLTVAKMCSAAKQYKDFKHWQMDEATTPLLKNKQRSWIFWWDSRENPELLKFRVAYDGLLRSDVKPPWKDDTTLKSWFYWDNWEFNSDAPWDSLLPFLKKSGIGCANCPINQLSKELLKIDLPLPCRQGDGNVPAGTCIRAMTDPDDLQIRVSMAWGTLPHVVLHQNGQQNIHVFEGDLGELLNTWNAQKEREQPTAAPESESKWTESDLKTLPENVGDAADSTPQPANRTDRSVDDVLVDARLDTGEAQKEIEKPVDDPERIADIKMNGDVDIDTTPPEPDAPPTPSAEMVRNARIATFMLRHTDGNHDVEHYAATQCRLCVHRIEGAEITRDTSGRTKPACDTANDGFSDDELGFSEISMALRSKKVPVCRQFVPAKSLGERIPDMAHTPKISRTWILDQIQGIFDQIVDRYGWYSNEFGAFLLVGACYTKLRDVIAQEPLSNKQLATLWLLLQTEFDRLLHGIEKREQFLMWDSNAEGGFENDPVPSSEANWLEKEEVQNELSIQLEEVHKSNKEDSDVGY